MKDFTKLKTLTRSYKSLVLMDKLLDLSNSSISIPTRISRRKTPLLLSKARKLGYKRKPYFFVFTGSILKGGINASTNKKGRTPSNIYKKFSRKQSLLEILSKRIAKRYPNLKLIKYYPLNLKKQKYRVWGQFIFYDPYLLQDSSIRLEA